MRYRFHVHKRLPHWRLVLAEGSAPPAGCVIDDWTYSRTREQDDIQADVREQVAARGFSLFQRGGDFADVARELRDLAAGEDARSTPDARASRLADNPIHLGLYGTAVREAPFTGGAEWFEAYAARRAGDGIEGRLITMFRFDRPWDTWEVHPRGSEVVLCTAGEMTLVQELDGESVHTRLRPGEYAINAPGVWHTADADGSATAVFITSGIGTEHRPR